MSATTRGQFISIVKENISLCREHYRLVLRLAEFPPTYPGQFVQISCRDVRDADRAELEIDWTPDLPLALSDDTFLNPGAMLRRPFSLAGRRDVRGGGVELDIIHRVVGVGTDWLSRLSPGDEVSVLGPLGNQFTLPPADGIAILVGGGVGIPPMLYLAEKLARRRAVVFAGALTRDLLPLTILDDIPAAGANPTPSIEQFARHGIPAVVSTDDGSYGFRGFVTQALEACLEGWGFRVECSGQTGARVGTKEKTGKEKTGTGTVYRREEKTGTGTVFDPASTLNPEPRTRNRPVIYTCGPEPMMKRVADIAASRNIDCQIAVERAMACGMGTCQSCCIRVKKVDPSQPPLVGRDWCYRLACTDGPVFRGADLLW